MNVTDLKSALLIVDKIFKRILFWQMTSLTGLLTLGGVALYYQTLERDERIIRRIFESAESSLTSEVYIGEANGLTKIEDLPSLSKVRSDLEARGVDAITTLEGCTSTSPKSSLIFHLLLGGRKLNNCLVVKPRGGAGWWITGSIALLLVASAVLLIGFWIISRTSLVQRLLAPLLVEYENRKLNAAVGALARQVAHDIRSPLSALNIFARQLPNLPQNERSLLQGAIARINAIADELLKVRGDNLTSRLTTITKPKTVLKTHLLTSIVEDIAIESQIHHQHLKGVTIKVTYDGGHYGFFSDVDPAILGRVISNLVNNAVHAVGENGDVTVRLSDSSDRNHITVTDNGRGIPAHLIAEVTKENVSFGEGRGSGLGLYHAKRTLEDWGGSLSIESEEGRGTSVRISLARREPPLWFLPSIDVHPNTQVVIVDDDPTVHHLWESRFHDAGLAVSFSHCYSPPALRNLLVSPFQPDRIFLVDYELKGYDETGLHLIQEFGIQERSILVTGHSQDAELTKKCIDLKVCLLPKEFVHLIPLRTLAVVTAD